MAETTYIVLRRMTEMSGSVEDFVERTDTIGWGWTIENSNVPAASAEAAIRLACKTDDKPAGTYVAVPARSFRPVTVQAVQTTVLKLEEATSKPAEPEAAA